MVGRQETVKEQARSIDALVKDSLVGRAVAKVCRQTSFLHGPTAIAALTALFPPGHVPQTSPGLTNASEEFRKSVLLEAAKLLRHWPSRFTWT